METEEEVYFELSDEDSFVRVSLNKYSYPESKNVYDKNWISSKIILRSGPFAATFAAEFMAVDFEKFKKELEYLYDHLDSSATFNGLERNLEIQIQGDGIGHLKAICNASDEPGYGRNFKFYIEFDQTQLMPLIRQLANILQSFPVIGEFRGF
ncbi:WapI family immunity protein [Mucilaginibacter sp. UYCu711]|uniref:WapI family immunity protein n=1 Tax=Mucilaginibacter sp. UYCu711 TaxID=3156339 RepID=UPI003D218EFE